ncbi:MAG: hypothetical protein AAF204_02190 [Pseudomonadota bacterium]
MDVLNKLSDKQRTLIVSLPYRVGLWVSESDTDGGDEAQANELTALSNIIHGFSEQVFGSELLQYIMNETVSRKEDWQGSWAQNIEAVPDECEQALAALREHIDDKEVDVYSRRLMEIGEAVALAFKENQGKRSLGATIAYTISKFKAQMNKAPVKSFSQYSSISMSERKALLKIADALEINYII